MPVRLVPDELLPPPLDGYRLVSRLGRGGFGEVWKVIAPGGMEKAAKFVFGDLDAVDEAESRPAEQEQKAINRVKAIRHPYILTLERFEVIEGQLIIVMELADRNLWDRFRQCRAQALTGVPRDELLGYMGEAAEALDLMNTHYGIQHLDIKPQNLFLVHNHVKVADFGLAKDMEAGRDRVTITGGVTPVYAAPETFEGTVSRHTDQYSLAIVFQELLTGTRPFNGANTKQLMMQHINGLPELDALSPADRRVIGRALAKTPEGRWPTCTEMVRALRGGPAGPPSGGVRPPTPRAETDTPPPSPVMTATVPKSQVAGLVTAGQRVTALAGGGTASPRPRLITPLAASGSQPLPTMTQARPVVQTGRMTSLGVAPPERAGDGLLFPALVVAVGQTGLRVVDRLRQMMADRFGSADGLPTVRFLYLDTDPDALAAAAECLQPLPARAVVPTRLNRATHYLQPGGLPVETWLPPGLLYKLPKNPGAAAGVRAFGRLALLDNAKLVAQRVRQEVEALLADEQLDAAGKTTGLGVRSNRLRAYVVAGLAGGTGSGMAIDLGYLLKHELRGFGYRKPEAVGVLLAPPADPSVPRGPALANVFGALHELRHFSGDGGRYSQRFDPAEPAVTDADGPFTRTALFNLPMAIRSKPQRAAWGLAARAMFTDLFTPAGKAAESVRSLAPAAAGPTVTLTGLHRLSWPRPEVLAAATRRFARTVLDRWACKEALHLRVPIQAYLAEEWAARKLDPGAVQAHLAEAARDHLREEPGVVFDAAVDSLRNLSPGGNRVDAETAAVIFDPLLRLVGKPPADAAEDTPLLAALKAAAGELVRRADAFLSELVVRFIELPQYRLAGADEAIAQLTARAKATTEEFEAVREGLHREVSDGYGKALAAIGYQRGALGARRAGPELADALSGYAHKRLRLALTDAALSVYRSLAGSLPEFSRDVAFVRSRLAALAALADTRRPAADEYDPGPTTLVLPDGGDHPEAGAEWLIGTLQPEDLQGFDEALQRLVGKQFRGLTVVCQKADKQPAFLALLADRARTFLDERLDRADSATVLLRLRGDGPATEQLLCEVFVKAAPDLFGWADPPAQAAVLAAPPGPAGDRVRQLAADACPDVAFDSVLMADDILVVRECPRAPLARLPHLGSHAKSAFLAQLGTDHPPHARRDVPPPD